jgi:hypothetical protein
MHRLDPLRFGRVRPSGWLAQRMRVDLDGFVGNLDRLAPDLIIDDDIYGADRLTAGANAKDLGAVTDVDLEHPEQFMWWNSETQSNWRDGWLRHILLIGDPVERAAGRAYVERMMATADDDGYLGIHAPDLRFAAGQENGELWAQATLGRALLAYVEAADDRDHAHEVLVALRRAMEVTMVAWPIGGQSPFGPGGYAGTAHGLIVTDVLDRLADLTGDEGLRRYAAWLYLAYSQSEVSEPDAQLGRLLDPTVRFVGHGVHTYEHLRPLVVATEVDPHDTDLARGLEVFLSRLRGCLTPAHGPVGDEWIGGRTADATSTGYELCSTQELSDSLLRLLISTGDLHWADELEKVVLNAGLGAWHPERSAVAYLQTDNAFSMSGNRSGAPDDPHQTRYRYSALHREAAVCCVPNAGRLLPTFLRGAVQVADRDVVVALYGPMRASVEVDGVAVEIDQVTDYPDELAVRLRVRAERPVAFRLLLRHPAWAQAVRITGAVVASEIPGAVVIDRIWHDESLVLAFGTEPQVHVDANGESFVTHGPRALALPIPSITHVTKQFEVPELADLSVEATSDEHTFLSLVVDRPDLIEVVPDGLVAPFVDGRDPSGAIVGRLLKPLGRSALRRLTFPSITA